MNFEEQILEAAKAIAAATSALVKSAATAQKELVASGVVCVWFIVMALINVQVTSISSIHFVEKRCDVP